MDNLVLQIMILSRWVDSYPLKYDRNHLANNYSFLSVEKKFCQIFLQNDDIEKEHGKERLIYEQDFTYEESN